MAGEVLNNVIFVRSELWPTFRDVELPGRVICAESPYARKLVDVVRALPDTVTIVSIDSTPQSRLAYWLVEEIAGGGQRRFLPSGFGQDGESIWYGPSWLGAGASTCFRCARLRQAAAHPDWRSAMAAEIAGLETDALQGRPAPPAVEALAGILRDLLAVPGSLANLARRVVWRGRFDEAATVLPRPDCALCGHAANSPPPHPHELVDARGGIVRTLTVDRHPAAPLFIAEAKLANSWFSPGWDLATHGKGESPDLAMRSALGEAVERYCATHWGRPVATTHDLAPSCDHVPLVAFTGWRNLRSPPEGASASEEWVRMERLGDGERRWLPRVAAYLDHPPEDSERYRGKPNSNGLAASDSLERAVLAGLLELIERDALLSAWQGAEPAMRVDPARLTDSYARALADAAGRMGADLTVALVGASHPVHVAVALLLSPRAGLGQPHAAIGAAASLFPAEALRRALEEAFQVHHLLAGLLKEERWRQHAANLAAGILAPRDPVDHGLYYAVADDLSAFDFLRAAPAAPLPPEPPQLAPAAQTARIVGALGRRGIDAYWLDLTTADVALAGWRCVRVVSPQLNNLYFGPEEAFGGEPARAIHPLS